MAVSLLATGGATIVTPAVGAAMIPTGIGAPTGSYVIASTPIVAASAGISASIWWDLTPYDTSFDNFIDNRIEPLITDIIDTPIEFIYEQVNFFFPNNNLDE